MRGISWNLRALRRSVYAGDSSSRATVWRRRVWVIGHASRLQRAHDRKVTEPGCIVAAMDFYGELEWRGLIFDATEGAREALSREKVTGYIGFDPTAASLHVGSLLVMIMLAHLQRHGHSPIAVVGGGTGLIGDPSGKTRRASAVDALNALPKTCRAFGRSWRDFSISTEQQSCPAREQRRLADVARRDRVHARRRQALHRERHAGEGVGEAEASRARMASPTPSSATRCCRRTTS